MTRHWVQPMTPHMRAVQRGYCDIVMIVQGWKEARDKLAAHNHAMFFYALDANHV